MSIAILKEKKHLIKFMTHYWMQTADLVFGDLSGAVRAFINYETKESSLGLLSDLTEILNNNLMIDDLREDCYEVRNFWHNISDRDLTRRDSAVVIKLLHDKLYN